MTVISTSTDPQTLTLTVVADFDASPAHVWGLWEDARQLERWWGPPAYPATFTRHDFVVGGESRYFMTGPNGETPHGWWRIEAIDRARRLDFLNGLAGDDGEPTPDIAPMIGVMTLVAIGARTRMTVVSHFTDLDQMHAMLDRGMESGMQQAIGQIDELLARSQSTA